MQAKPLFGALTEMKPRTQNYLFRYTPGKHR
jgi:hypothetical protein